MSKFTKALLIIIFVFSLGMIGHITAEIYDFPAIMHDKQNEESSGTSEYDIRQLAAPAYLITGAGSYEYRYTESDSLLNEDAVIEGAEDASVYSSFTAALKKFFETGSIEIKDVTESAAGGYGEILTKGSIMALFKYDIPLTEYFEYIGIENSGSVSEIGSAGEIALLSDGSVFVYDGTDKKYYILNNQSGGEDYRKYSENVQKLINTVSSLGGYMMQSVSRLTGVENDTAIPVGIDLSIVPAGFAMEMSGADAAAKLKPVFFSDDTEFVKKIDSNDGVRIWMYGTGKKVLRIGGSGVIEYHERLDTSEYEEASYYDSLKTAAGFVNSHGGWPEVDGASYCVRSAVKINESDCSGYLIRFGVRICGTDVMYGGGDLLSVEVYGNQVVSYVRNMPDLGLIKNAVSGEPVPAANLQDIIKTYSSVIADVIVKEHSDDSTVNVEKYMTEDKYYAVNSGIKDAHVVFVKTEKKEETVETGESSIICFVPSWYVNVDGISFWFDAATGEMLDPVL